MEIKKLFLPLLFLLFCFSAKAQDIKLAINDSCEFVSQDGKSYIIVEYPGKTAHEIYEGISTNIVKYFNDAKNVTNSVPDKAISVRAFSNNLIEYCWWKEPKKFTLGKAALAYVTAGISLAVDAAKTGSLYNSDFKMAGFYKLNIEVKDGKAKIDMPIMDGGFTVYDILGEKSLEKSELTFKDAVKINKDKAVATRDSKKEKAEEANKKKEKFLQESIERMEKTLTIITKLQNTDW